LFAESNFTLVAEEIHFRIDENLLNFLPLQLVQGRLKPKEQEDQDGDEEEDRRDEIVSPEQSM
jgi:hypothetical protein